MKNKIIVALALLSLLACGKKDSDNKAVEPVPAAADPARALVVKPDLTESQKEEIKGFLSATNALPKVELLIEDTEKDSIRKGEQEAEVKKMETASKQIYEKLKADCQITKLSGTDTGKSEKIENGSKVSAKASAAIKGDKCPIDFDLTASSENTYVEFKKADNSKPDSETSAVVKGIEKFNRATKIKMQDLQTQTGLKEETSELTVESTSSIKAKTLISLNSKTKMTSKFVNAKDQKMNFDAEVTVRLENEKSDVYMRLDLELPNSNPTIQAFKAASDSEFKYFLNGKETKFDQIRDILSKAPFVDVQTVKKTQMERIQSKLF
jgi:hypothetical protein